MPEHTPASRSSVMDLMALRSVTELPVTRRHVLDPEVLRTVAAVDRVGDLTRFNVAEVPELAQISAPEELLAPDERGWALGHALSLAVEHGQRLWLSEVPRERLGLLRNVLGEHLVHIASLEAPDGDVLRSRLVVMSPRMSKGLEFDVVVLVDPAVVGRTSPGDLYVAMTRPTRRLRMVSRTAAPGTARPARSTSAAAGV